MFNIVVCLKYICIFVERNRVMKIEEYRDILLKLCDEHGHVTKLDILSIGTGSVQKSKSITKEAFLEMFNRVKQEYRGTIKGHRKLDRTSINNLKEISKDYTLKEIEGAAHAMFMGEWALNTGNDIPAHLLVQKNFERYYNIFENGTVQTKRLSKDDEAKQRILARFIKKG